MSSLRALLRAVPTEDGGTLLGLWLTAGGERLLGVPLNMDIRTGDLVAMETLGDELVDPSVLSCRRCLAIGESTLGQLLRVTSVSSFPTLRCAVVPTDSSLDAECDRGPPCSLIKEFKLGENDSGVESLSNSSGSVVKPSY